MNSARNATPTELEISPGRARKRLGATLLSVVGLLCGVGQAMQAQTKTWAQGSFELPMEVNWNNTKLAPGKYRFKVVSTHTFGAIVSVEHEGKIQNFTGPRKWVREGKGMHPLPRLVLHVDSELGTEVVQMELRGPNLRLTFNCVHKKKKGREAPRQASVFLTYD